MVITNLAIATTIAIAIPAIRLVSPGYLNRPLYIVNLGS